MNNRVIVPGKVRLGHNIVFTVDLKQQDNNNNKCIFVLNIDISIYNIPKSQNVQQTNHKCLKIRLHEFLKKCLQANGFMLLV